MSVRETVESIQLVDNHAHEVRPFSEDLTPERFASYFTEGPESYHARHTIHYRNAIDVLSEYFGVNSEQEVLDRRADVDFEAFSRDLFERANVSHILQDTGTPPDSSPDSFRRYTDAEVSPILRVETEMEPLIEASDDFSTFVSELRDLLVDAVQGPCVGLKSIVAYRTGLNISEPSRAEAATAFDEVKADWTGRIEHPVLLDYTAHLAAEIAGKNDVPIQFHSGFGDADAHPRYVDPGYMWAFMNRHPETDIVLLHASYPYTRTAGYIVSVLENVYLDLGMTIPFVQHGTHGVIRQVLELAPSTKLLYSSDGFYVPEWHYLAAKRIRADLADVLENLIEAGFLREAYAETIARNVLRENARRVYRL
ncbi:amidohydrolase family protein [Natrarchaeobius sp. A-rgal3]|uniref:amidohydrolase family protein n=1 Tax=Natrarchaeobius versutus TaxID=1679078 RepID=UPI00350F8F3E